MTLPDERFRATSRTREFLLDLCTPSATPRVPSWVRDRARALLKHFPTDLDLDSVAEDCPDIFARQKKFFSAPVNELPAKKPSWMHNFLYGKKQK
jgi:hypothetical protein